jgi:superfamily II DNA or RNA helicase
MPKQAKEAAEPKTYGCKTKDNQEFRFHIGQYAHFLENLAYNYIEPYMYSVEEHPLYKKTDIQVNVKKGWALRDEQQEASDFIIQEESTDFHTRLATLPTGAGKSQPLDAKLKIPGGWTTMGEVKLGDVVTTRTGTATYVTGVFDQGIRPVYRVTMEDGRSTKCDEDHLWEIYEHNSPDAKVITTLELKSLMSKWKDYFIDLPLPESTVDYNEGISNPHYYGKMLSLIKTDEKIEEKYLYAGNIQRTLLLVGILSNPFNKYTVKFEGVVQSKALADDIVYLVRSFGGTGTVTQFNQIYSIECYHPDMEMFYDDKEYVTDSERISSIEDYRIKIKSIEYVGEEHCKCISISDPGKLYVTDDFIVTHNTVLSIISVLNKGIRGRILIVVLPKYVEKWCNDLTNISDIKPKKVMPISGSAQVKGLIQLAQDHPENLPDAIVLSLTTMQNFFKGYEENRFSEEFKDYGCNPEDLCKTLGIGNIIIDEVHEHLYSVYKFMCYTHVPKIITLSGTVVSDDPFIQKMHHVMFPKEIRFDKIKMKKYIKVFAISYNYRDWMSAGMRTTEHGSRNYSQIAYEKSIIKKKMILDGYLKLLGMVIDIAYIYDFKEKDKLAVYAGSIAMCDLILAFLKNKYPKLDIRRYVEQDPYANVIDSQIRVTTILSAGTALDIPDLRAVVMTNSINSPVSNLQTLGRLRELKDRDVKFFYLYCTDIPKQVDYHHRRKDLFADRVLSIKEFKSPMTL